MTDHYQRYANNAADGLERVIRTGLAELKNAVPADELHWEGWLACCERMLYYVNEPEGAKRLQESISAQKAA